MAKSLSLNVQQQKIARVIVSAKRKLTTKEISEITKFSWKTTKENLEVLRKRAPISKETLGNRIYWFVRKK